MKRISKLLGGAAVLALLVGGPAHADKLAITNPDQAAFDSVAGDVTAAFDLKPMGPSAAGGLLGFSVGAYGSYAPTRDSGAWQRLTGSNTGELSVVGLNVTKGLPLGFDVGGFVAAVPGANGTVFGFQVRDALLEGSALTPALALRASYTGATGLRDFDYRSYGLDLSVSKGFLLLTPNSGLGLQSAHYERPKGFVGLRFSLFGLLDTTAEYDRIGGENVYDLRLGFAL